MDFSARLFPRTWCCVVCLQLKINKKQQLGNTKRIFQRCGFAFFLFYFCICFLSISPNIKCGFAVQINIQGDICFCHILCIVSLFTEVRIISLTSRRTDVSSAEISFFLNELSKRKSRVMQRISSNNIADTIKERKETPHESK